MCPLTVVAPVNVGDVNIVALLSLVTLLSPTVVLVKPVTEEVLEKLTAPVKSGEARGAFKAS